MSTEATQSFLVRAENAKAGVVKNFSQEEKEKLAKLEFLLSKLGKYTIGSFVKNKLSILKMPEVLINALISRKLDYSQAKVINLLREHPDEIEPLIHRAYNEKLSKRELQQIVSEILAKTREPLPSKKLTSPKQKAIAYGKIGETVKKLYPALPEEKKKEVDSLFAKLARLIG
jgi:ParB family chromosome partitioning protein